MKSACLSCADLGNKDCVLRSLPRRIVHSVGEVGTAAVTVMIAGQEGLRHAVSQHREAVLAGSTALEACIENHQASQIPYSIDWLSLG